MTNVKEHFVWIDVAKEWFDVAVLGEKNTVQFANTKGGIGKLVKWMKVLHAVLGALCRSTDDLPWNSPLLMYSVVALLAEKTSSKPNRPDWIQELCSQPSG